MDEIIRYGSTSKERAVSFMNELNKKEIPKDGKIKRWRIAVRLQNRIAFDIDNNDIANVRIIYNYYTKLFGELVVYKTYSGYHIFTKKIYTDNLEWQYDTCRVLYPILQKDELQFYIENIEKWYIEKLQKEKVLGQNREEFIGDLKATFPLSSLFCGIGDFDILFAINVILKGYYCLRVSKKAPSDNPYLVSLE